MTVAAWESAKALELARLLDRRPRRPKCSMPPQSMQG
jgi:hypothetical protein